MIDIPSFLLRRDDDDPRARRPAPAGARRNPGPPPWRGPHATSEGVVRLVEALDTTEPISGIVGPGRLPGYLDDIDIGTVLVHRPVDPAIPYYERPWQAGRVHLDGIRWEEKTWPPDDFIAFRDHVASLLEFTVPGDERWESRKLPVVGDVTASPSAGAETPTRRK